MDITEPAYVGHSHLGAVLRAARERGLTLAAINLREEHSGADLQRVLGGHSIVSLIGGGTTSRFGLLKHEMPFDFFLTDDEYPELTPPTTDSQIIPYAVIYDVVLEREQHVARFFKKLIDLSKGCSIFHIESPPPIESTASIAERFNRAFPDRRITEREVTPAMVRLKLWRLHSAVTRDICRALGVTFIPAPPAACDHGYLRPDLISDASHGNTAYGHLVLDQIGAI